MVCYVLVGILGIIVGFFAAWVIIVQNVRKNSNQVKNLQKNIDVLNQWLILKSEGLSLAAVLEDKKIYKIAIYGMGICGRHLIRELENTRIEICYGMDMKVKGQYKNIHIYKPGATEQPVDAIINTVIYDETNIVNNLKNYYSCKILNLSDLIFNGYIKK